MNDVGKITDAVLQEPYIFKVKNETTNEIREYRIKPVCLGCLLAISKEVSTIDFEKVAKSTNAMELLADYADTMLRIVCMVIFNSNQYPQKEFEYMKNNLTAIEMYELLTEAVSRIDTLHFQKSIILSQKMSLINREIIARSTVGNLSVV